MAQTPPTDWKAKARSILNTYYRSFEGTQWHEFDLRNDRELLKVKICYALYGPPTNAQATSIEEAYSTEQKAGTKPIINSMLKVERKGDVNKINIGFAFVVCHQVKEKKEFPVPVFSVLVETSSTGVDKRKFVDTHGRVYKSWRDWKENNSLPKVKLAYPQHGYFTCRRDGTYGYDAQTEFIIEFGESPQCSAWAEAKKSADIVTGVSSLGTESYINKAKLWPISAPCFFKNL